MTKRTVYVVNRSGHDYGAAEKFGNLIYLSDSIRNKTSRPKMNTIYRDFFHILKKSNSQDLLLDTGLPEMRSVAWAIMSHLHGRVNILKFLTKENESFYVERNIVFVERETLLLNDLIEYEYLVPAGVSSLERSLQPGDVIKITSTKEKT